MLADSPVVATATGDYDFYPELSPLVFCEDWKGQERFLGGKAKFSVPTVPLALLCCQMSWVCTLSRHLACDAVFGNSDITPDQIANG